MSDAPESDSAKDFASRAAEGQSSSLAGKFGDPLKDNKTWWLAPIVISILGRAEKQGCNTKSSNNATG